MKLHFYGAANCVTGSNYFLQSGGSNYVIDCGLFQGDPEQEEYNGESFAYEPSEVEAVILTHSHIDHSGRLPKLVKDGFVGKIYCSHATRDLCEILLLDAAKIQEYDAQWENKKRDRAGLDRIEPIYDTDDVYSTLAMFNPVDTNVDIKIDENITLKLNHTGHLLGACSATIKAEGKTLTFSGDLGTGNPILLPPGTPPEPSNVIICESTYGNRLHPESEQRIQNLVEALESTLSHGGTAIIPAFSVGRTQQILYDLYYHTSKHPESKLVDYPIYVDSPLAINATEIYNRHMELLKPELKHLLMKGETPFAPERLKIIKENDKSMALNKDENPKIIISASGMCDAGRIRHHLKHYLWKPSTAIIFVGYQAEKSLGRAILDGKPTLEILGEIIANKARIYRLTGYSGHGDQRDLINWIKSSGHHDSIILSHGETESIEALKALIEPLADKVYTPILNETIEL